MFVSDCHVKQSKSDVVFCDCHVFYFILIVIIIYYYDYFDVYCVVMNVFELFVND